jgi:magnesium chelatase accessory protein
MKLRLFHHHDGARVAYREAGAGPPLALLHSELLSHREFEPVVAHLRHRHRVVLPDLPLHGDSEDRPRHPYTLDWLAEVVSAFCVAACGPRPIVGGHGLGAQLLLRAIARGSLTPARLVLMSCPLHGRPQGPLASRSWRTAARAAAAPGLDRVLSHGARMVFRPERAVTLTARGAPAASDLLRHAFADVGGNANLARSWSKFARRAPRGAWDELREIYPGLDLPVLLLWADSDELHPVSTAEETVRALPNAQLRVLPGTGYLMAYDDAVGVAREIIAFCG